jgi:peptidoglycan hydrolase-like protein with peptidoglycan-binding domain
LRWKAITGVFALGTALAAWAATPAKKPNATGSKKTATKTSTGKASTSKASTAKASTAKGSTAAKSATGKKAASQGKKSTATKQVASRYRRSSQREPAPERYQEIQQSLAEKGYFSGPVNGAWGADSVAALKRFQRDQNIGDDGKLGSLSLIALGLGPKRGSALGSSPEPGAPDGGTPARSEQ